MAQLRLRFTSYRKPHKRGRYSYRRDGHWPLPCDLPPDPSTPEGRYEALRRATDGCPLEPWEPQCIHGYPQWYTHLAEQVGTVLGEWV